MEEKPELLEMTADIVSAYVGNNTVTAEALPALIANIHAALSGVSSGPVEAEPEPKEPAVPIRKSINPDFLICLEDGRKFKSLKRHLRTKYDMSPEEYRAKWAAERNKHTRPVPGDFSRDNLVPRPDASLMQDVPWGDITHAGGRRSTSAPLGAPPHAVDFAKHTCLVVFPHMRTITER